ncbi:MAG TPA: TIGR03560 family F420-dependent LLM class oxidoreductase [Dehalococcoidia bacterium]|nr:TIGR03560 family F420-dependent LLM class oxidoreductase [Dehalococcoidia bacterium]
MELGVLIEGQEGLTWERWRRTAVLVEELGFGSLWRSDHLLSRMDERRATLDTWTSLAVAAAETSRLTLGPLVCPVTFYQPVQLAKSATAVDTLSGGRLVLGLGIGWNEREHRAFGLPFPPSAERGARLRETIEVLLRLWGEGPAAYAGRYYCLDAVEMRPKPAQRPRVPLLIGGAGPRRTLPLVARYADEWNVTTSSPALVRERSAALLDCCRAIGRDPATIRRSVALGFIVAGSLRELGSRCELIRGAVPDLAPYDADEVPEAARRLGWVCGTPDTVAAHLRELAAEGVTRVMLGHFDLDDEESLRLIAREVLPAVAG